MLDNYVIRSPLPESSIIKRWKEKEITVSICMLTYNHELFIEKTLFSILNQKTNFGFEILVHDDASTDKTRFIIEKYQKLYPNIIKPIFQNMNQWSKGVNPSVKYNYPRAKSKFVAWCEGDDMWIDDNKLAYQVSIMMRNPMINISFHQAVRVFYSDRSNSDMIIGDYGGEDRVLTFEETVFRPHGLIPTASMIVRQKVKEKLFAFMENRNFMRSGDVFTQFIGSLENGALYIAKPMSVYRYQTPSSLTMGFNNIENKINHEVAVIRAYLEYNYEVNGKYYLIFKRLILQRILWIFSKSEVKLDLIKKLNILKLFNLYVVILKKIDFIFNKINNKNKKIIIYGIGSGCDICITKLKKDRISFLIDRDKKQAGNYLSNFEIKKIDDEFLAKDYFLLVSSMSQTKDEINYIYNKGFDKKNVFFLFDELLECVDLKYLYQDKSNIDYSHLEIKPPAWWCPLPLN